MAKLTLPSATLAATTASVAEGTNTISLTVTLSAAETYTATVGYSMSDGTATAGSDYTGASSTLNFAPGVTSQVISVPILNDTLDEPDETFSVTLNSPTNARLATPSSTTVTITDDDPTPTVGWQASNFNAGEAAGSGLATVLLSAASSFTVTVNYATSNGTASAGSDYTSKSGTPSFTPGQVSQSFAIAITDDTAIESNETINLTLSSPTNATLGTASATMTILDDDGGAQPTEEFYTYDAIGNMLSKTGVGTYTNGANGNGTGAGPHRIKQINGGAAFVYDANGNLTSGGGASYTWDAENRPLTISTTSGSESYAYDADGERVEVVAGSTTTVYLGGLWEETSAGTTKAYYTFNGQIIAVRDSTDPTDPVSYLHGDHLGSVSVASGAGASNKGSQHFDPWGKVLSGGITQTRKNYTGQYLDTTGLLYYHARYYNPVLARFVSADSIVPGQSSGAGAADPQNLNRYSYGLNNPVKNTDPTGHCVEDLCIVEGFTAGTLTCGPVCGVAVAAAAAVGTAAVIVYAASGAPIYNTDDMGNPIFPVADTAAEEPAAPDAEAGPAEPVLNEQGGYGEDQYGPHPYGHLEDPPDVGPDKPFSDTQREKVLEENRKRNGGVVRSDQSGKELKQPQPARYWDRNQRKYVTRSPDPDEWTVDHRIPRARGGTNSYKNAEVKSRRENNQKKTKLPWE